jgi:hypothetical protein
MERVDGGRCICTGDCLSCGFIFVVTLGCRTYQAFEIKRFWIDPRANVSTLESLNWSDGARYRKRLTVRGL